MSNLPARRDVFETFRPWLDTNGFTPARIAVANALCDRLGLPANDNAAAAAVRSPTRLADPAAFFAHLRAGKILGPVLTAAEVAGCNAIIDACGADGWPVGDTAYALATAWLETAATMQPIKEIGGDAYFHRMYDIEGARPAKARELGNLRPGDGARYPGGGYVQLTGYKNYLRAGTALGIDLVNHPERALERAIAAAIMVRGMRDGWFTGRDLDDDIPRAGPATLAQFIASRDIINGTDKARAIADAAIHFQHGLLAGRWG
ncbi:MAG: hypothetical protein V4537_16005 [Pseudomonadota bacterium]